MYSVFLVIIFFSSLTIFIHEIYSGSRVSPTYMLIIMIIAACLWYENGDLLRQIIKKLSQAKEVRGPGGTGAIFDTPEEEELKNPSISIQEFTRNDNSS